MFAVPATPAIFGQFFAGGSQGDLSAVRGGHGTEYVWIADELWIYCWLGVAGFLACCLQ